MASHLLEDLGEAEILFGNAFVGVEDFEKCGSAGASGAAGGVGELEGGNVGDVGGGLAVGAAGDHADVFAEFVGWMGGWMGEWRKGWVCEGCVRVGMTLLADE